MQVHGTNNFNTTQEAQSNIDYNASPPPDQSQYDYSQNESFGQPPLSPSLVPTVRTLTSPITNSSSNKASPGKKKRGRPSTKPKSVPSTIEWNDDEIKHLCSFWSREEILYNAKHPKHFIKEERDKAVKRIVDSFQALGMEINSDQVLNKMTSLRSYFCAQRNKEQTSRSKWSRNI